MNHKSEGWKTFISQEEKHRLSGLTISSRNMVKELHFNKAFDSFALKLPEGTPALGSTAPIVTVLEAVTRASDSVINRATLVISLTSVESFSV